MTVMFRRLWIQLTADRRRFGILCAAVSVLLLFWARLIIISNAPRTVMADESKTTANQPVEVREPTKGRADKTSSEARQIALHRVPSRDPFVIPQKHFPLPKPDEPLVPEAGKSGPKKAEDPLQAALRRKAELRSLVDRFTLDGCFLSKPPMAVISGKTYRPGDEIPGIDNAQIRFKLVEVRQGIVTLEFEGHQFPLKMDSPGF